MHLGKALFQLKRYQQALDCFNKILWLLPNNQEALANKEFTMRQLIFPWPATIVKKNREYNIAQWRIDRKQFREAHNRSSYLEMPFKHFIREVMSLTQKKQGEIDFDELFYLSANSDVEQAVASGSCLYGYIHFCMYGQYDNRPWSTRYLERVSGLAPNMPKGLAAPVNSAPLKIYGPDLSNLQRGDESLLFIFLPHLQDNLFFAGYSGFFNDLSKIFDQFSRIVVLVLASEVNPQLAKRYCNRIEVIAESDLMQIQKRPDIVFCFNSDTFYMAKNIFGNLDRTIYYCQDFEAGFYPYGTQFARAEGAVAQSHNIVLSTLLLKEFMEERKLLSAPRVFVTSPSIEILDVEPEKTKKIMFYFRPEVFNTRNMPELIMSVIEPFCLKHQGYEIFLVGSVDTSYSRKVYGTDVVILSKLPKEQYNSLLKSCDVVVAFIYSAHPGVIAFQAAASGIPTVTNIFEGRDAECLKSISENIVPFDPVRENLLDNIELALNMSKGKKSFNKARYEGASNQSFSQYVANIMQIN